MTLRTATCGSCHWEELSALVLYHPFSREDVSGATSAKQDGVLLSYFLNRFNHVSRSDYELLDGRQRAKVDEGCTEGFPADGEMEIRGDGHDSHYRYAEGPKDKAFMEQKDREYLTVLRDSDIPHERERFEEEIATLNLSLEHHCNLKREFEPFTRAYREAAGGGGEGGGGETPAWEAKIAEIKEETEQRIAELSRQRDEDRATMAALKRQVNELVERLGASLTAIEALSAERTEARAEMVALRRQVEQAERLRVSEARAERLRGAHSGTDAGPTRGP